MKDRAVEFPNRFKIIQVPNQPGAYDVTPFPGAITEVGTPISKATLLRDDTLSLFTNTESTKTIEETPDGVFQVLARANATSIMTILKTSQQITANSSNRTVQELASFADVAYDATGKCTTNKVYVPKGIKKVRISAVFSYRVYAGSVTIGIYKNGSEIQSILIGSTMSSTWTEGQPSIEFVANTSGNGTEYFQIYLNASTFSNSGTARLSCEHVLFQMLSY